jgi:hypothetical protein
LEQWRNDWVLLTFERANLNAVAYKDKEDALIKTFDTFHGRKVDGKAKVSGMRFENKKLILELTLLTKDGEVRKLDPKKETTALAICNIIFAHVVNDPNDPFLRAIKPGETIVQVNGTFGLQARKGDNMMIAWRLNDVVVKQP